MDAIALHDIRKEYPRRGGGGLFRRSREPLTAVDGVALRVPQGEFFGLLGPNGAGKTTLVRIICTMLEPTAGTARIFGYDVVRQSVDVRRRLGGVLTGERSLYWKLTGRENLQYFGVLYRLPPARLRERVERVLREVDLLDRADEYVERYSHGMRQRLILARALLPDPPLLVLDEPTIGLDPAAARSLRDTLRSLHAAGRTILLTTHYMEEADQLCERVGIIDHGRIIALDSPAALKRSLGADRVVEIEAVGGNGAAPERMREVAGVSRVLQHTLTEGTSRYHVHAAEPRAVLSALMDSVTSDGARLTYVRLVEPSLEDVFLSLTGRGLRNGTAATPEDGA